MFAILVVRVAEGCPIDVGSTVLAIAVLGQSVSVQDLNCNYSGFDQSRIKLARKVTNPEGLSMDAIFAFTFVTKLAKVFFPAEKNK